jgi:FAD/FMN-containing dehydrogenase
MKGIDVIRSLARILDKDRVVHDEEELRQYSRDALDETRALPPKFRPMLPIAIVRPITEEDVITIVKFANKSRVPLVPYGGGTGLMGGATTLKRGVVVDMRNMKSMEISTEDLTANVGAGVVIRELASEAKQHGLLFAHDPWSAGHSTVGGTIATNGVGYLACKYGSMGDQVLGLRAVTGGGNLLEIKPAKKKSTGFELNKMFIGSEGVLGIITHATLKLYPLPSAQKVLAFEFDDLPSGYRCVRSLFSHGVQPASLDLFEAFDVNADVDTRTWLQDPEGTRLYVAFDGFSEEVDVLGAKTMNIVKELNGSELSAEVAEEYWRGRYDIANRYISFLKGGSTNRSTNRDIKFDFIQASIPAGKVLEFDKACMDIASKYKIEVQGHGIWQAPEFYSMNLFAPSASANDRMYMAMNEMLKRAIELGTMEYVHGVGMKLAHLMKQAHSDGMNLMKRIKRVLDPSNIMNPGKLSL